MLTDETIDTIVVLEHIGRKVEANDYFRRHLTLYGYNNIDVWQLGNGPTDPLWDWGLFVYRRDNIFYLKSAQLKRTHVRLGGTNGATYPSAGFKFLETLADKLPIIRERLARPIIISNSPSL